MAFTPQEKVLDKMRERFGKTAFTENHINYRRVGFRRGEATLSAIGDSWNEAMATLERKAAQ